MAIKHSKLEQVAKELLTTGPLKVEQTPRRVRGLLGGRYIFDTTKASFVWEHKYFPHYYLPLDAFGASVKISRIEEIKAENNSKSSAWLARLETENGKSDRVVEFSGDGPLNGLVKIEFNSIDSWFVEDEQIFSHPKDPYSRLEYMPTSREVRIEIDGVTIAKSLQNVFLYETHMRPRYYISATSINWEYLKPSESSTFCPYKGDASYYSAVVNGKEYNDIAWYYKAVFPESAAAYGRVSFYNEKVDVFVDGVKENR